MIYPYIVVKDGVWYDAGNDVPETSKPETEKTDSDVAIHTKTEINSNRRSKSACNIRGHR